MNLQGHPPGAREPAGKCDCGGNLHPYDPEGVPPGTYPGNYTCDRCDAVYQRGSETLAGRKADKERKT